MEQPLSAHICLMEKEKKQKDKKKRDERLSTTQN